MAQRLCFEDNLLKTRDRDEAHLSAQSDQEEKGARFSGPNEDALWSKDSGQSATERPVAADGLKKEGLSRAERLRRRRDFERVYREGKRLYLPYLKLVLAPNQLGLRRLGLSVSRKFGKAVRRNRAKRLLREIFRRHKGLFPASHDVIFIPKPEFLEKRHEEVIADLKRVLEKYEKDRPSSH